MSVAPHWRGLASGNGQLIPPPSFPPYPLSSPRVQTLQEGNARDWQLLIQHSDTRSTIAFARAVYVVGKEEFIFFLMGQSLSPLSQKPLVSKINRWPWCFLQGRGLFGWDNRHRNWETGMYLHLTLCTLSMPATAWLLFLWCDPGHIGNSWCSLHLIQSSLSRACSNPRFSSSISFKNRQPGLLIGCLFMISLTNIQSWNAFHIADLKGTLFIVIVKDNARNWDQYTHILH